MGIHIEFFNKERSLLGFSYEFLRMCNSYDEKNNPIIDEYHTFTIGLLILNIQLDIKA